MSETWSDETGQRWAVDLKVDREKLVNGLWRRAEKSKRGRATAMNGAIVLQITEIGSQ